MKRVYRYEHLSDLYLLKIATHEIIICFISPRNTPIKIVKEKKLVNNNLYNLKFLSILVHHRLLLTSFKRQFNVKFSDFVKFMQYRNKAYYGNKWR